MNIKNLVKKYTPFLLYAMFGVLTTVVNLVAYWLFAHVMNIGTMASTMIAWIAAVLFAYLTNRKWVFGSEAIKVREVIREVASFFVCRLATGIVDWACMLVFVDLLRFNDMVIKVAANIVVIILNYVASKLVIFKRKQGTKCEKI